MNIQNLFIEQHRDDIILLSYGGSYAYGTNVENSDVDLRGIYTDNPINILSGNFTENIIDHDSDTVLYSLNKMVSLLCKCNPNVIEILGCRPQDYFILNDNGKKLIDNSHLFRSRKAIGSFGGYANDQLRRLENYVARNNSQEEREKHILNSIKFAKEEFAKRYSDIDDLVNLYIDKSNREEFETEIFADIRLNHYPLRDWCEIWNEMQSVVQSYSKIGKRNKNAITHNKLAKHQMHLVRLYFMAFDILLDGKIVTYRDKDHDLLMQIRNGVFLKDDKPTDEFFTYVDDLETKLKKYVEKTDLPKEPNYKQINNLVAEINYDIIKKRGI